MSRNPPAQLLLQLSLLLLLLLNGDAYDTPEDCTWSSSPSPSAPDGGGDGVFLTCRLSSINSRLERTNFSVIPAVGTRGLRVLCNSNADTATSHIEPGGFASLHQLEELVIEGCALDRLPQGAFTGLSRLQRLIVHGSAIGGGGASSQLVVEPGVLAELPSSLHYLDLSQNGLARLPAGELCQLEQLHQLNLSSNALGKMADLFGDVTSACLPRLESLDLSGNQLVSVESSTWAMVAPQLQELRLSRNYIRHVDADNSSNSSSSSSLRLLDLSQNQLSHLPPTLLHSLPNLQQLLLGHNQLAQLAAGLLVGQLQLQLLDLSGNHLAELPVDLPHLANLAELNLGGNRLETVTIDALQLPTSLRILRLAGNRLHNVTWPSAATNTTTLPQLQELDLSDNNLADLGADSLSGLTALTHLSLASNRLTALHPAAFRTPSAATKSSGLLVLDLSGNQLTEVPEALKHLAGLQTLDLGGNRIEVNGGDVNAGGETSPLAPLTALWRLQLHNNRIGRVSASAFASLTSLQVSILFYKNIFFIF